MSHIAYRTYSTDKKETLVKLLGISSLYLHMVQREEWKTRKENELSLTDIHPAVHTNTDHLTLSKWS